MRNFSAISFLAAMANTILQQCYDFFEIAQCFGVFPHDFRPALTFCRVAFAFLVLHPEHHANADDRESQIAYQLANSSNVHSHFLSAGYYNNEQGHRALVRRMHQLPAVTLCGPCSHLIYNHLRYFVNRCSAKYSSNTIFFFICASQSHPNVLLKR